MAGIHNVVGILDSLAKSGHIERAPAQRVRSGLLIRAEGLSNKRGRDGGLDTLVNQTASHSACAKNKLPGGNSAASKRRVRIHTKGKVAGRLSCCSRSVLKLDRAGVEERAGVQFDHAAVRSILGHNAAETRNHP